MIESSGHNITRTNDDPFFQSCKEDPVAPPRQASRGDSGGASGAGKGGLTPEQSSDASVASELDVDRFFRERDLEELTRKTYDSMGLEVRDVLARSDLYENEVAGRYLVEAFIGPGARTNWRDTVLGATGERLNPDYFVNPLR